MAVAGPDARSTTRAAVACDAGCVGKDSVELAVASEVAIIEDVPQWEPQFAPALYDLTTITIDGDGGSLQEAATLTTVISITI